MMDAPERLLDHPASPLERALLLEGRGYSVPAHLRAHTLSALGLTATSSLVASLLAWLSARSAIAKLGLVLSALAIAAGVPVGYLVLTERVPASLPTTPIAAVVPLPEPTSTAPVPSEPAAAAPAVAPTAPSARPAARSTDLAGADLRAELRALDAVRTSLADDDPTSALTLLAGYFHGFPRGRLRYEAQVLRIEALARTGQVEVAKRHAQEFLRRHPNSVLTARVRPYAER